MKINGIKSNNYTSNGNELLINLVCTADEALAMDTSVIKVTTDQGDLVEQFVGFVKVSATVDAITEEILLKCLKDDNETVVSLVQANEKINESINDLELKVNEIETEGTNPQMTTFAALMMPTITPTMTVSDIASIYTLLPEWKVGASYKKGEAFSYQGKIYRAAQDIPEAQEIYPPGEGMESLYTLIDIAPDGIRIWHMPTDATNSFANGEKAHYPNADSPVYISKRDGNTSEPGTDEWWVLEGEEPVKEPDEDTGTEQPAEYDPEHQYAKGERCTYNGQVYEWTLDVPGVWTPEAYPQGWKLITE